AGELGGECQDLRRRRESGAQDEGWDERWYPSHIASSVFLPLVASIGVPVYGTDLMHKTFQGQAPPRRRRPVPVNDAAAATCPGGLPSPAASDPGSGGGPGGRPRAPLRLPGSLPSCAGSSRRV